MKATGKQLHRNGVPREAANALRFGRLTLRKATLLDTSFIFDLMMEGAVSGSFSDRFLDGSGKRLLWMLLRELAAQTIQRRDARYAGWSMVFEGQQPVGFMKMHSQPLEAGPGNVVELMLLAVAPERRNQGLGTALMQTIIDDQPPSTTMIVHCKKYARSMQRILKNLGFERDPHKGYPVEEYWYIKKFSPAPD